jgi:hypothetical protein
VHAISSSVSIFITTTLYSLIPLERFIFWNHTTNMPSLPEKTPPAYQPLPASEVPHDLEQDRPTRTSWSTFSKSQWLLILIALYAVGMMGVDSYLRFDDSFKHHKEKPRGGACPVQPKPLGKGPGFVSAARVTGRARLICGVGCSQELYITRCESTLTSRSNPRKLFPFPPTKPSPYCLSPGRLLRRHGTRRRRPPMEPAHRLRSILGTGIPSYLRNTAARDGKHPRTPLHLARFPV